MSIQLMLGDLAIQSIAVDAQNLCGFGLISTRFYECGLNESFFKFAYCFAQINSPVDHFCDKGFQLLFHNFFPRVGQNLFIVAATSAPARGNRQEISLSFRKESLQR